MPLGILFDQLDLVPGCTLAVNREADVLSGAHGCARSRLVPRVLNGAEAGTLLIESQGFKMHG